MNLAFRLAQGGVRADLPPSLAVNPELAAWIRFVGDGRVQIRSGKVEIGQGIRTALAQIAAEELCLPVDRIDMIPTRTGLSPDEAVTSGSLSIQESGVAIRHLCADVRTRLVDRAAGLWAVAADGCRAEDGCVVHDASGRRVAFDALDPGSLLGGEVASVARCLDRVHHRIVGRSVARPDLPAKIAGEGVYLHDMELPGLLHGRVIRARMPGAVIRALDPQVLAGLDPGVSLWRDGNFLGVTSAQEWRVVKAADLVERAAQWDLPTVPFHGQAMDRWLPDQPAESKVIAKCGEGGAADATDATDATGGTGGTGAFEPTYVGRYSKPFIAHAAMAPSCAIARWEDGRLDIWSHSQGVYNLRTDLEILFPDVEIVVQHVDGAGCYGHNGADDVALDAALLARSAKAPVRVLWSRRDELIRSPLGSAMAIEIRARLDDRRIVAWTHDVWSYGHSLRPGRADTPTLLAAAEISGGFAPRVAVNAALAAGGGSERNAIPIYDVGQLRVTNHRLLSMPVRTSALRSLGAFGNVFAIESAFDELAARAGMDPFDFRLAHLSHPRARRVLEQLRLGVGEGWRDGRGEPGGEHGGVPDGENRGWGIGFAHYKNTGAWCAVAARIEVADEVRVDRLIVAVDVGLVVNPDGVRHQIEGGALQAVSWALHEEMAFDEHGPTGLDWEAYPIARFSGLPRVEVVLIDAADEPPVGAGECAHGPTAAALGNAVNAALGLRLHHLPLSRRRIIQAIEESNA